MDSLGKLFMMSPRKWEAWKNYEDVCVSLNKIKQTSYDRCHTFSGHSKSGYPGKVIMVFLRKWEACKSYQDVCVSLYGYKDRLLMIIGTPSVDRQQRVATLGKLL